MTLSREEADKLARDVLSMINLGTDLNKRTGYIGNLCNHILSGSMKREIENAAFLRCAVLVEQMSLHTSVRGNPHGAFQSSGAAIRSLIQPSAQKENGE